MDARACGRAFGTGYLSTTKVRINASVRVAKVFFQHEQYADAELPAAVVPDREDRPAPDLHGAVLLKEAALESTQIGKARDPVFWDPLSHIISWLSNNF